MMNAITTSGNATSIAIAPRENDLPLMQLRSGGDPAVNLVNATPSPIKMVQIQANGSTIDVAKDIGPYQVAATPDYVLRLHQAPDGPRLSSFLGHAIKVTLDTDSSFTVSLNLGTAVQGVSYLTFYLMTRGVLVVSDLGDPRAIGWV